VAFPRKTGACINDRRKVTAWNQSIWARFIEVARIFVGRDRRRPGQAGIRYLIVQNGVDALRGRLRRGSRFGRKARRRPHHGEQTRE